MAIKQITVKLILIAVLLVAKLSQAMELVARPVPNQQSKYTVSLLLIRGHAEEPNSKTLDVIKAARSTTYFDVLNGSFQLDTEKSKILLPMIMQVLANYAKSQEYFSIPLKKPHLFEQTPIVQIAENDPAINILSKMREELQKELKSFARFDLQLLNNSSSYNSITLDPETKNVRETLLQQSNDLLFLACFLDLTKIDSNGKIIVVKRFPFGSIFNQPEQNREQAAYTNLVKQLGDFHFGNH